MNPIVLLCTGGIGSGKSFVVKAFNTLGYPSYDCDAAAKELYDRDPQLLEQVAQLAGGEIIKDGRLDRKAFAERLFADKGLLSKVEALVHPAVIRDFEKWKQAQQGRVVIIESAILLERPNLKRVADRIIAVTAPRDIRICRVIERDGCTQDEVLARMGRQWSDEQRAKVADWVIENDGKQAILPQILNIIEKLK